jgi:tetratricopeptide (TPR) repeat protein/CHAT domain-containing protein
MRPVRHSLLPACLLAFAFGLATPAQAQEPADTIGVESALVDSLQAALDRFKVAEPPTARDSARLRRWADSVQARDYSLLTSEPSRARHRLRSARRAYRGLADSSGVAKVTTGLGRIYQSQGRYEEALARYRESLKTYREIGARKGIANALLTIGSVYSKQDHLEEALPRLQQSLETYREIGARKSIANALLTIGSVYHKQGRPKEALSHLQQSMETYREVGDRKAIAATMNSIGLVYHDQNRFEEALSRLEESLRLKQQIGVQEGNIARTLHNIGIVYGSKGRPDRALDHFQEALKIGRQNRRGTASTLGWIAGVHSGQGRFDQALSHHREALKIKREIGEQGGIASELMGIGGIYSKQGRYDRALSYFREALKIYREIGDQEGIAGALNSIGLAREVQGRPGQALARFREALEIFREIGKQGGVGSTLNNMGNAHQDQGNYEEALARYREALKTWREIGARARTGIGVTLGNIGVVYSKQGRLEEALSYLRESLEIHQEVGAQRRIPSSLYNIGKVRLKQGQTSTDTLGKAVRLSEKFRLSATSPEARRSLLSTQIGAYRALTTAYVRAGEPDSALRSAERARARLLADRLAGAAQADTTFAIPSASELRRSLGPEEAALLYLGVSTEWPLVALAVTTDTTYVRELPDSTVQRGIGREHRLALSRLRREEGPMKAALREGFTAASDDPGGPPSLAETIRLYRHQLTQVEGAPEMRRDLSRRFHRLLIQPVEGAIAGKDELVVVPGGTLGYLPFEALRDSSGTYLVEKRRVRYAQSLTVLRQLRQREYEKQERPEERRPLLALGGAEYGNPPTQRGKTLLTQTYRGSTEVATEQHASTLRRDADRRLGRGESARPTYAELGFGRWRNLPGTKKEVERLGRIVGQGATVITGQAASEQKVRALSENGRLEDYRRVHLAAHGVSVPEAPALSALVLSQVGASDSLAARDGYLNMEEIAGLDLQADVAVLSACRTGLGRIVAGEGVVSLSHAFLRAGANATLVSQWKVLDESTRQFMTAVYERAKAGDTSFAEAVTEAKRAFIDGKYGKKNTDPLRWAPFVYYGRE